MEEGLTIVELAGQRGLRLTGELTAESVPRLVQAFESMQGAGQATLDVSQLTFVDSTGLHAIAALARGENGSGRVILEGVKPQIARLLEITDLAAHPDLDIRDAGRGR